MDSELSPDPDRMSDDELRRARPGIIFRLHQGLVRSNNEDWCGWSVDPSRSTFVVCDGMGGHEHGEHASRAAGREFLAAFQDRRRGLPDASDLAARLEARLEELKSSFGVEKMGTTLTGLVMRGNGARVYHVGDSRAYLFREGRIIQLTRDHTYVEELELSEEEAVVHPLKHMINRAVGITGLELDVRRFLLQPGDRLLICSDGFWNAGLLRRDLLGLALSRANSEQLADDLMDQALRRGAPDNLSLLLLERDFVRMMPDTAEIRRLDPQGRFEGWQPLGEGTTAQVYAAVDRFSGRQVVLKLARDRDMARMFRGEVELLRRLAAPVFPELLDFVPDGDGVTLIVMERRGGRPLDPADTRGLAPAELARLLAPLAQGLCELADLHHLHGDISPGNVLLDHTRISLLDLGLARPLDKGLVDRSGTLATMAPERLATGHLHGGGDVWSLGVLGWTLICGQPPFPEDADACVRAILDGQRRPPGQGADHPLMPLMLRCLEPDPEQRPTARQLLHALLAFSQPGPELVPRRPAAAQVPDWCRQLLEELGSGHSGTVWGSGGGEDWIWLDWLQHESALAGLRLLRLDAGKDSPLEWARLHLLRHPGLVKRPWLQARLLSRDPLPASRAERRRLLNALLDFLSDTVDGTPAGLLLVRDTEGETDAPPWLEDWDRLCTERRLPWAQFRNGVAPPAVSGPSFQLVLVLPDPDGFRRQLATLLPGLDLEPDLQAGLDAVSDGRLQTVLDALRLNLSRGCIAWVDGRLRIHGELTSPAGAHRIDPEELEPVLAELLAEISAWSLLAGQALWSERLASLGAGNPLARLEAEALVRNRGDGVPAAVPGLAARLQPARSERAHQRLLAWLADRPATPLELKLEHLAACGNQPVQPELLLELAEASSGRGYPEARIRVLDRALQVAPPARQASLGSLLVQACQEMGQWDRARSALRNMFTLPGVRQGDRVQALIQLGHLYSNQGKGRLARRAFAAALATSDPGQPVERLKALTQLALSLWQLGRIGEARGLLEEGVQLLTRFDPPWNRQLSYQANVLGALAFGLGDSVWAGRLWQELLSNSGSEADPGELARVRMNLALVHAREDRLAEAGLELERAAREARDLHFETVLAQILVNQAHLDFLCGRLDEAGRRLAEAERICGLTDDRPLLLSVLYASADVEYRRGHLDEAFDKLDRLVEQGRLQQRPYVTCEAEALHLLIESDLGLLPEPEREAEFIRQCQALDQEELLVEWLLVAASLDRPADARLCTTLKERLTDSPLPALLEHIGAPEALPLADLLEEVRALPRGSWPLRDRLLLHLAARESAVPGPLWLLEELDPFRLGPFQQVHLGLCIGTANLHGGQLAKAGEQLGHAVNILRAMVDSRVMHGTERFRQAPVTQALARTAQLCQRLIRESPR